MRLTAALAWSILGAAALFLEAINLSPSTSGWSYLSYLTAFAPSYAPTLCISWFFLFARQLLPTTLLALLALYCLGGTPSLVESGLDPLSAPLHALAQLFLPPLFAQALGRLFRPANPSSLTPLILLSAWVGGL